MPRFFMPELSIPEGDLPECITLTGEDAFHLSVSLRSRIGDEVMICGANGVEVNCRIEAISGGKKAPQVLLIPTFSRFGEGESPVSVTLFQGMPKGKKTDSILQKCTELGVDKIVFVYSDRSIPLWDGEDKKVSRFEKITEEAAKQCGRAKLVKVSFAKSVDEILPEMKEKDLSFACYEDEKTLSIKELISKSECKSAAFFIGPEGGLSEREAELFRQNGIPSVTLGKRILRTETAASAVLSMFLYEKEL